MTTQRDELLASLRDAHAMESQAETMLAGQAKRLENYPALRARIERHVEETQNQRRLVGECLERLGESSSSIKDTGGKFMAMGQSLAGMVADDEVLKGVIASYAFEHMEIASYRMLISMAKTVGEPEIQRICEGILKEEEGMAAWLEQHMMDITQEFMMRLEGSTQAGTRTSGASTRDFQAKR
ncbi:MAG: ferritin-like domain-containing protein [Pseudomonadota bacterium]|nr:ferritin-like domain-containing protein [Pseudomonadota bacterium]